MEVKDKEMNFMHHRADKHAGHVLDRSENTLHGNQHFEQLHTVNGDGKDVF